MGMPKQIQQQSEQVEAMMRGDTDPQQAEEQVDPQPEPQPEPQASAPAEDSVSDELQAIRAELEKSEQRYRTLHGMIRQKDDTIRQMETLLAQMQEAPAPKPEEQKPSVSVDEAQDRDEFGDDFVDMVYRAIDRRLGTLEQRLGTTERNARESYEAVAESRTERFYSQLASRVPDWKEIDNSPEFAQWLQQSTSRVGLVKQGMANFDVDAIAELFEHYKVVHGIGQAEQPASPAKPSLERKVAPSKGRPGAAAATTSEQKVWTRSEITQVYRDRRRYSQKEFDGLQRDIFAAQREGRVDYSK